MSSWKQNRLFRLKSTVSGPAHRQLYQLCRQRVRIHAHYSNQISLDIVLNVCSRGYVIYIIVLCYLKRKPAQCFVVVLHKHTLKYRKWCIRSCVTSFMKINKLRVCYFYAGICRIDAYVMTAPDVNIYKYLV